MDANKFLDKLTEMLNLKNDAALSRTLGVQPPVISKIRHGWQPLGPALLVKASLATDLNIRQLKELA